MFMPDSWLPAPTTVVVLVVSKGLEEGYERSTNAVIATIQAGFLRVMEEQNFGFG